MIDKHPAAADTDQRSQFKLEIMCGGALQTIPLFTPHYLGGGLVLTREQAEERLPSVRKYGAMCSRPSCGVKHKDWWLTEVMT